MISALWWVFQLTNNFNQMLILSPLPQNKLWQVKGRRDHSLFETLVKDVLKVKELAEAKEVGKKEAENKAKEATVFGRMFG